jgi:quercetin dioxygenase-like cupin family protein
MKRRLFFQSALLAFPLIAPGLNSKKTIDNKPFAVKKGEGRYHGHIQLKGVNSNIQDVKVSGKDTGGQLAIFEQTGLSPKRGVPLHIHPEQDEIFQVLEGEYHFQVDQEKFQLKQGETIFLPRKIAHAWIQVSEHAKMSVIVQPAGMLEEFFVYMAALEKEPTKDELAKIFSNHGMQIVGPPMKPDN